jgi:hypothetical protein
LHSFDVYLLIIRRRKQALNPAVSV